MPSPKTDSVLGLCEPSVVSNQQSTVTGPGSETKPDSDSSRLENPVVVPSSAENAIRWNSPLIYKQMLELVQACNSLSAGRDQHLTSILNLRSHSCMVYFRNGVAVCIGVELSKQVPKEGSCLRRKLMLKMIMFRPEGLNQMFSLYPKYRSNVNV